MADFYARDAKRMYGSKAIANRSGVAAPPAPPAASPSAVANSVKPEGGTQPKKAPQYLLPDVGAVPPPSPASYGQRPQRQGAMRRRPQRMEVSQGSPNPADYGLGGKETFVSYQMDRDANKGRRSSGLRRVGSRQRDMVRAEDEWDGLQMQEKERWASRARGGDGQRTPSELHWSQGGASGSSASAGASSAPPTLGMRPVGNPGSGSLGRSFSLRTPEEVAARIASSPVSYGKIGGRIPTGPATPSAAPTAPQPSPAAPVPFQAPKDVPLRQTPAGIASTEARAELRMRDTKDLLARMNSRDNAGTRQLAAQGRKTADQGSRLLHDVNMAQMERKPPLSPPPPAPLLATKDKKTKLAAR